MPPAAASRVVQPKHQRQPDQDQSPGIQLIHRPQDRRIRRHPVEHLGTDPTRTLEIPLRRPFGIEDLDDPFVGEMPTDRDSHQGKRERLERIQRRSIRDITGHKVSLHLSESWRKRCLPLCGRGYGEETSPVANVPSQPLDRRSSEPLVPPLKDRYPSGPRMPPEVDRTAIILIRFEVRRFRRLQTTPRAYSLARSLPL